MFASTLSTLKNPYPKSPTTKRNTMMGISKFYKDTLGANLANSRWSWGAFNPSTNQLFLRVWGDQIRTINGQDCVSLLLLNSKDSSMGLPERKRHIQSLQQGTEGYGVVCTAIDKLKGSARTIKSFDEQTLLKFGQLSNDGTRIYAEIIDRVPVAELSRKRTGTSTILSDLRSIFGSRVDTTTREALANARVGQGLFRAMVLSIWKMQCCVTGSKILDAIRASHIKPWRDSSDHERLDPFNGLPLVANLDALFDAGLISFADDGVMLVSKRLNKEERKLFGLTGLRLSVIPKAETAGYLAHHRQKIFRDN